MFQLFSIYDKKGQGQPQVSTLTVLVHAVLRCSRLQTKFHGHRSSGRRVSKVFTIYEPGGHLGHVTIKATELALDHIEQSRIINFIVFSDSFYVPQSLHNRQIETPLLLDALFFKT